MDLKKTQKYTIITQSTNMTILRGNVVKHYIHHRKKTMSKGKILLIM